MIRIYLAGRVGIETPDGYVDESRFAGNQGRLIFALLACEYERPVARSEIAETVWADELPDGWDRALSAIVSKLRAALHAVRLDPECLTRTSGGYQLRLEPRPWIDVQEAERALEAARTLVASGRHAEAYGWALASSMIARRPFLPGDESAWSAHKRRILARVAADAADALIDVYVAQRQFAFALKTAEELLAADELDESGYRQLMRVHHVAGNRPLAVRAYERCCTVLARELGIVPSEATRALYDEVIGV